MSPFILPHRQVYRLSTHGNISLLSKFLNNLITNDVNKIVNDGAGAASFLSSKGRVLFEGIIYNESFLWKDKCSSFLIDVSSRINQHDFESHMRSFFLRYDFILEDSGLSSIFSFTKDDASLFPDPRNHLLGYRSLRKDVQGLSSGDYLNEAIYHLKRFLLACPEAPYEIFQGQSLPLECNLDDLNFIDFQKGCYLGQELTTRTRHSGVVRKSIFPVHISRMESSGDWASSLEYHGLLDEVKKMDLSASLDYKSPKDLFIGGACRGRLLSTIGNSYGLAMLRHEDLSPNGNDACRHQPIYTYSDGHGNLLKAVPIRRQNK